MEDTAAGAAAPDNDAAAAAQDPTAAGQHSMKDILTTMNTSKNPPPRYEDVALAPKHDETPPTELFDNLKFSPNAVVGKATCIQLKPSGTSEVDVYGNGNGEPFLVT